MNRPTIAENKMEEDNKSFGKHVAYLEKALSLVLVHIQLHDHQKGYFRCVKNIINYLN